MTWGERATVKIIVAMLWTAERCGGGKQWMANSI